MYLHQVNPHGGDVFDKEISLDFSSNINPLGMPQAVKEAIVHSAEYCDAYPDPYCRKLRESISAYEDISCDRILCGNGAAELIYAYAYALEDDRPALIVAPTFCEYQKALCAARKRVGYYLLREDRDFTLTEDIMNTDLSRYSAVFLCTPNNPTGIAVDPELLYELAGTGVRVFADMCFLDLTDDPDRYELPKLIETYPNVTVLRAFTKSFAMAGVRLGYVFCSDAAFLEQMSEKTQCWNVSTVAQQSGIAATNCGGWLKKSVKTIKAERERMTRILRSCGINVYPSEANYLLLHTNIDLYERLLQRRILIRDCSDYIGLSKGYYRIAVRTRPENDMLLTAIKEVIQ